MLCYREGLRFSVHWQWAGSLQIIPVTSMSRRLVWAMSLRLVQFLRDGLRRLEEQVTDDVVNSFETY